MKIAGLLFIVMFTLQAEELIKVTRDPRPEPTYVTYESYRAEHPVMDTLAEGPTVFLPASNSFLEADNGLVALVVASNLASPLKDDLAQWAADLQARGYSVEQSTYSASGKVENLKTYLKSLRSKGLVGAVLVGELPVAWFQVDDDWARDGVFNPPDDWYEEFPTDLFLADLDGTWKDDSAHSGGQNIPMKAGQDSIYDSHTGLRAAEIWVSRIDASRIMYGDMMTRYHEYFARIHAYRQAELVFPSKGYFYVDNDWRESFYNNNMNMICDEVDEIRDTMLTFAEDYKTRLVQDGLFMTVLVHSSPFEHYFVKPNFPGYDPVSNWMVSSLGVAYGFYNLFACSNCRWVESNCMGSLYHFSGSGLASIGSTKTGSMLDFNVFNAGLAGGLSWGDAFRELTNYWITVYNGSPNAQWARSWFMGLCILGDGTLDLLEQKPVAVEETSKDQPRVLSIATLSSDQVDISFNLGKGSLVRMDVYDASGGLVANIEDRTFGPGNHHVEWNPGNTPSGVYFVRLSTPAFTLGQKIVLSK